MIANCSQYRAISYNKPLAVSNLTVTPSVPSREATAGLAASSTGRARDRSGVPMTRRSAVRAHGGMVPGIPRKAMLKCGRNVGETVLPRFPVAKTAKLDNRRAGRGETGLPMR